MKLTINAKERTITMWIKYIQLKNFQNIKTGLNAKELTIDFSNRENVICLFVGPNGIGKTSLLSCLTPFATLGNLDIRDSNQLVVKGENGYKKIIIMDGSDEYVIQHFYTASKETHTVKSYITLNGTDLNPNGNVTSFKSTVSEYLGIDMDYLKLIRLGDNVTNLIKLKSTERKNFMSKFLDSVNIYLKYHQKISGDVRDLKLVLSHTLDKIKKLGIEDPELEQIKIDELRKSIQYNQDEIDSVQDTISKTELKINELSYTSSQSEMIKDLKRQIAKYEKVLTGNNVNESSLEIQKKKQELETKLAGIKGERKALYDKLSSDGKLLEDALAERDKIELDIRQEVETTKMASWEGYLKSCHEKREKMERTLPVLIVDESLTKEEVDDAVVTLKNLQKNLNVTYEFGQDPIKDAVELIRSKKNVQEFVASNLVAIEKKKKHDEKTYLDKIIDKYAGMQKPSCSDCFLTKLYDDIMMVRDIEPANTKKLRSPEYYVMVNAVYENISSVISGMEEIKDTLKKFPDYIQKEFVMDTFFGHILKCEFIYDDKKLNQFLLEFTEHYNYSLLLKEIDETIKKINILNENSSVGYMRENLKRTEKLIKERSDVLEETKETLSSLSSTIVKLEDQLEEYATLYSALTELESVREEYTTMVNEKEAYDQYSAENKKSGEILFKLKKDHSDLQNYLSEKEMGLATYKRLTDELNKTREMYDDLLLIRSSTSNKDGIPLLYIQFYLKNIRELANALLDIVYEGSIYIQDFYITGDEFKIPFVKNGIEIPDISYASQGEQSFLSMAISFALSSENLEKYNIPLLDEVDSTFDASNRERFLSIIEHQNDIIRCEQEFVISHNNMFSQYPVDVLDFGNIKASKFEVTLK